MTKHELKNILLAAMVLTSSAFAQACGDDDDSDDQPVAGDTSRGGRGGRGGNGASGAGGVGGKTSDAGNGDSGGRGGAGAGGKSGAAGSGAGAGGKSAGGTGGANAGAGGADACKGDKDCYSCEPKETLQYLNHCTDSQCEPFDNSRLPLLKADGSLPALP
jgi:hypothetical protein